MMIRPILSLALAGSIAVLLAAAPAMAAGEAEQPPRQSWSFSGPFGTYDRAQLQRGFKVYREVCQTCHGLDLLSFRNLGQPGALGFSEAGVLHASRMHPAGARDVEDARAYVRFLARRRAMADEAEGVAPTPRLVREGWSHAVVVEGDGIRRVRRVWIAKEEP